MTYISLTSRYSFLFFIAILFFSLPVFSQERCIPTGQWLDPNTNVEINDKQALERMLSKPIILMGEHHQNPFHHQWHLTWLKKINAEVENLELALEMLPVQSQTAIDRWVKDEINDKEFIEESGWNVYWQHDVDLYLPVLKFAKVNHIPMHAINVSKQLLQNVSMNGWDAIPESERSGLTDPGPASRPYLLALARSFRRHGPPSGDEISEEEGGRFKRFIEVQLLWDRAMGQGIAKMREQEHKPVVLAMMGSGHMMHGFGTPLQLNDLKHDDYTIIVPWDDHLNCEELKPGFADLVYGSPPN